MEFIVLLTAFAVLGTSVLGFIAKLQKDVREIHIMVNSRMDETLSHLREQKDLHTKALTRIDQLDEVLRDAGIRSPNRLNKGNHEREED